MEHLNRLIQANKWRPIEEAPKEGSGMYLIKETRDGEKTYVGARDSARSSGFYERGGNDIHFPRYFHPLPTDDLAEICEDLVEALEVLTRNDISDDIAPAALQRAEQKAKGE